MNSNAACNAFITSLLMCVCVCVCRGDVKRNGNAIFCPRLSSYHQTKECKRAFQKAAFLVNNKLLASEGVNERASSVLLFTWLQFFFTVSGCARGCENLLMTHSTTSHFSCCTQSPCSFIVYSVAVHRFSCVNQINNLLRLAIYP